MPPPTAAPLSSRPFGVLPTGEAVTAYTLRGTAGLVLECLDYGGIVTRLLAPDRAGRLADVVLGLDTLEAYLAGHPYFGAITGRVAGRITGARFTLDGHTHSLAPNDPPNHLHGGLVGFDKQLWQATPLSRPNGAPSLRLSRTSPAGEEGYPGTVRVSVTYTVTADNSFLIETEAETDAPTPLSLTHHSYFNLAGHDSGTVHAHTLQVHADAFAPTNDAFALRGRREPVTAANDFRSPRRLGDAIPGLHQNHGDLYFLDSTSAASLPAPLRPAATFADPASGRILTVTTTEACLQLYTAASLSGALVGKGGHRYPRHAALCLECESYPDGVNTPALGDIVLRPGRVLRHATAYRFTTS
jgi:aldose 1-epimerase